MIKDSTLKGNYLGAVFCLIAVFVLSSQLKTFFPYLNPLLLQIIGCMGLFTCVHNIFNKSVSVCLSLYFVILFLNFISGDTYFGLIANVIQEVSIIYFSLGFFYYFTKEQHANFIKSLMVFICIFAIYTTISSVIVDIMFPGTIRDTVMFMNQGDESSLAFFYSMGMASYRLPHALPIIIPALVYVIRTVVDDKFVKNISLLTLISIFVLIYISYATTPLLLSLAVLLLSICVNPNKTYHENIRRCMLLLVFVLPFILNSNFLLDALKWIVGQFGDIGESYIDRLSDMQDFAHSGSSSGDVGSRVNKYNISLQYIQENFIFGTNQDTGQHSAFLDRLAALGLVGFVPYVCLLIFSFKDTSRYISGNAKVYYIIGVFAAIMMLTLKNMSYFDIWFMLMGFLPTMLIYKNK